MSQMGAAAGAWGLGHLGVKAGTQPGMGSVGPGAALCTWRPHTGWFLDRGPGGHPARHLRFPFPASPGFGCTAASCRHPGPAYSGPDLFIQAWPENVSLRSSMVKAW